MTEPTPPRAAVDRCFNAEPHDPHRALYGGYDGDRACPGVPTTACRAEAEYERPDGQREGP